jgi:hypothetical protein
MLAGILAAGALSAQSISFQDATLGALPPGWTSGMTHKGGPPKWEVVRDGSVNVLAQTSSDRTGGRFPFAVYDGASFKDGSVSVRFKAVSGRVDQAAGLVWRFRDADNYYIVRANALEDNVVLYKVEKGERISLAPKGTPSKTYGVKQTIAKQAWNTLKVDFRGGTFAVSFNGAKIMEVEDTSFTGAGKTGVWTKADSVIYFNDFTIQKN